MVGMDTQEPFDNMLSKTVSGVVHMSIWAHVYVCFGVADSPAMASWLMAE